MAVSTVPDWLTTDFFQSCLQSHKDEPITVTRQAIEPAIPAGNNYGSQLLRVKLEYNKKDDKRSISLIVKLPLSNVEELFSEIYEREQKFYNEFINETYKYRKHDIVPKHYISPNPRCVVLEDLSTSGYVMVDRHNLLDLEHCQLSIKAKAKLHALSVAIYRKTPKVIDSLVKESPTFIDNFNQMNKVLILGGLRCMAAYLEDKPDCKNYLDIIKEASDNDNLWNMIQEVDRSNANKPLKALIQLDPWCTNMMFKYNSLGKVDSVKLLDYQSLAFTTPLKEIVTFLSFCPDMEVRETKMNSLYYLYCDELNKNLAELKCPERLTFEEMKAEIVAMHPMVLYLVCSCLPIGLAEEAADWNEYLSGNVLNVPIKESPIYKLYQSPTFNRYYPHVLDGIAKDGVFDCVKEKMKQMKR